MLSDEYGFLVDAVPDFGDEVEWTLKTGNTHD